MEVDNKQDVAQMLLEKSDKPTLRGASGLGLDEEGIHKVLTPHKLLLIYHWAELLRYYHWTELLLFTGPLGKS